MDELRDKLIDTIKILNETIWEFRATKPRIDRWLDNFAPDQENVPSERLHALYLLSQFMYFGNKEMRELLRALYRDLFKYPIVKKIREENGNTTDVEFLDREFQRETQQTLFLGVGNPSESGTHLLYYFRQENRLPKTLFVHSHQIFERVGSPNNLQLRFPGIKRYVFIDDFCGSGTQAKDYSDSVLRDLKALAPDVEVSYYALFATKTGRKVIREETLFDNMESVLELDDSFQCFGDQSRYFVHEHPQISSEFALAMCQGYGSKLYPSDPLGYANGQLLIGFFHNTPDNTLPLFWFDDPAVMPWTPIFRRYPKFYGWWGETS